MKNFSVIFCIAFSLRIFAAIFFGDKILDHEFDVLARNFVNGFGYSYWSLLENGELTNKYAPEALLHLPSAYMPILYPLLVTLFVYVFGYNSASVFLLLAFQSFLGAINCLMIGKIFEEKFNKKSFSLIYLTAFFPLHIFMSTQISASTVYVFLISCVLLFYHRLLKFRDIKHSIFLGISLGLLTLSRADAILIIPAIIILLTFIHRNISSKYTLVFALSSLLIIAPLSVRNYNTFGFFYPLTISGGLNLWLGNNDDATGSRMNYVVPYKPIPKTIQDQIQSLKVDENYEVALDNIYKEEAKQFIINNPLKSVKLSIKKIIFFWVHIYDERVKYPLMNNILYWGPWIILLPFFMFGFRDIIKDFKSHDLEIFLILYFTFIYSVFFVLPRYRLIVLPIYLILSMKFFNKKFQTN
ncbi:MAG: glycosyltransferase family 39 protein [Candidatus Neomarinimicrobiota bacterium]|nr:glycosyltransferase family 39 protein [Candidatus Neomarinimicrobiota bacterium]